jgi:hypothetical protein
MKWLWTATIVATLLNGASACAQNSDVKPSATENARADSAAADLVGTDMVAELSHSVSATKAKPGDVVKAALTQDVLAHGRIIIRRGSKLMGHVTETKVRTKDDQESRLGMVFDKAVLKDGQEISFTAAILALAPGVQVSSVDRPDQMPPPITSSNSSGNPQPMGAGPQSRNTMSSSGNGSMNSAGGTNAASRSAQLDQAASSSASTSESASTYGLMGGGSRGVFGLPGLRLAAIAGPVRTTIITSIRQNVKLESGTQLVIQVNNLVR